MSFFTENGDPIDISYHEVFEQYLASNFIDPNDCVLELGARYGVVSFRINSILNEKTNHIAVEPDLLVWDALEKNRNNNRCQYQIIKGFVSLKKMKLIGNGLGTTSVIVAESSIPSFTLDDIRLNKPFTVLIADCEGALESFIEDFPQLFDTLLKVIYEEDRPDICNYKNVELFLFQKGFIKIINKMGGLQNVWVKLNNMFSILKSITPV